MKDNPGNNGCFVVSSSYVLSLFSIWMGTTLEFIITKDNDKELE